MMIRKTLLGLGLAFVLALPSAGQSQDNALARTAGTRPGASPGAQEFLSAFQTIRDYSLVEISDSTLWRPVRTSWAAAPDSAKISATMRSTSL